MDLCCEYDFGDLTVNEVGDHVDTLVIASNGLTGLDGKPIRKQVDPKGQADGGIIHPAKFGPRIIVFTTVVAIRTVVIADTDEYFEAVNRLEADVVAALEAKLNSPDTLTWTPTGLTQHTISCTYGTEGGHVAFTGSMLDRQCSFTLIAANPTITVA